MYYVINYYMISILETKRFFLHFYFKLEIKIIKSVNNVSLYNLCKIPNVSHQDSMSVKCILPYTPLLYSKTVVYMEI